MEDNAAENMTRFCPWVDSLGEWERMWSLRESKFYVVYCVALFLSRFLRCALLIAIYVSIFFQKSRHQRGQLGMITRCKYFWSWWRIWMLCFLLLFPFNI